MNQVLRATCALFGHVAYLTSTRASIRKPASKVAISHHEKPHTVSIIPVKHFLVSMIEEIKTLNLIDLIVVETTLNERESKVSYSAGVICICLSAMPNSCGTLETKISISHSRDDNETLKHQIASRITSTLLAFLRESFDSFQRSATLR